MRGFTVVELLIVIALASILVIVAIPIYGNLQVQAQLKESASQIVQTLRTARQDSLARFNNSAHGVYFDINALTPDSYILYHGDSYLTRDSDYDRVVELDDPLSIVNQDFALLGTDVDINFSQGLGRPNNVGSFNLNHDIEGTVLISVNSLGKVEED